MSKGMSVKKCFVEIKDNIVPYTVVKTRRKTIGIIVDRNGEVKVHVPFRVTEKQINEVVQKKADWIIKKVNEVKERNSNIIYRQYVSGEKFLYLGKEYILEIVEKDTDDMDDIDDIDDIDDMDNIDNFDSLDDSDDSDASDYLSEAEVLVKDDTITVYISKGLFEENRRQAIKEVLIKWYRHRFVELVKERIDKYSLKLKVIPCKVVIKNQKTRWGSCSNKGNINLNWRLIMAPLHIIDYVVVHEMCHLKVMNHSKDFWNLVESILPNYRECREWFKVNGYRLEI